MVPNPVSDLWGIFKMRLSVGGRCIEGGTASLNQNASGYVRSVRPPERSHRYHIAMAALRRANRPDIATSVLIERCRSALDAATAYAQTHFEDPPEIRDWIWDHATKQNN